LRVFNNSLLLLPHSCLAANAIGLRRIQVVRSTLWALDAAGVPVQVLSQHRSACERLRNVRAGRHVFPIPERNLTGLVPVRWRRDGFFKKLLKGAWLSPVSSMSISLRVDGLLGNMNGTVYGEQVRST